MKRVEFVDSLPVAAAKVWRTFSDFGHFLTWHQLPIEMQVEGQGVGMVRTLVSPQLGRIGERLDRCDDASMQLTYSLVEGEPLGMVTYEAKIEIVSIGTYESEIRWCGSFSAAPNADLDRMGTELVASYQSMTTNLAHYLKSI